MECSKVTKKGQMTIPVKYRRRYVLEEGVVVVFEEREEGLLIKPLPDIADSAGALSNYGNPKKLIEDLLRERETGFR